CVIDASAMAGTFAALAYGLQHFRPGLPWAGVLANRVAGERHAEMLQKAVLPASVGGVDVDTAADGGWLGAVLRDPAFALPERHLGLTVAAELPDALQRLDAAADALAGTPLGQMDGQALARWQVAFEPVAESEMASVPSLLAGRTVAVARDAAFCFIYPANLDCLQALGARLVFFSPLADEAVPDCDAVWLPGGYPELHAKTLAQARRTRDSLAAHVAAERPLWAECGGMVVLFDRLYTSDGEAHTLWGLLPGTAHMQPRLAGLGPQQLALAAGTLRGHTFHYSRCETALTPLLHTLSPLAGRTGAGEALLRQGSVLASYFHAWFPSCPVAAASLFLSQGST
ncbi:cobyrinate a,c-diamide synthase, partial [Hydrogenophaga sp.]|uniref:cobyrinate a,c-diamide synthase n=1 Tax=Hydrogenophaga sp. TaxID=1904254 RepID=UPI00356B5293